MPLLSIIIPAYNEEKTLATIVLKVLAITLPEGFKKEIIICDDCSTDQTNLIATTLASQHAEIKLLRNPKNLGKTQTVRQGLLASSGDFVIIQDADLEYDPEDIIFLLQETLRQQADVCYGNRFGKYNGVIYLQNFYGNLFLSAISSLFTSFRLRVVIPDMEVCYKLIRGDIARELADKITAISNFGFEPEITARLSRYKKPDGSCLRFLILPISYYPRSVAEGKKMRAVRDGLLALWEIFKYNLF